MSRRIALAILFISTMAHAVAIDKPAPSFSLQSIHQQKRSLSSYKGKVVFINFWASWCAPCQQELPELSRLASHCKGKKVQIVAINVDQDREAAKKLLTKLGLGNSALEILWDPTSAVVSRYNIEAMPTSFIVDPQGTIRFIHSGFRPSDPPSWRTEIDQLL